MVDEPFPPDGVEHFDAVSPPHMSAPTDSASELPEAADVRSPAAPPGEAVPRGRTGSHRRQKPQRPFWLEAVVLLAIAMGIALIVHTFLFQAFFIPSGSMENTLHVGDRVLVNRLSYQVGHVQRGQIIVFNGEDSWTAEAPTTPPSNPFARVARDVGSFLGFAPAGEKDFIKRVIGVPGDHVVCCDAQGRIKVNGAPLNENYLASGTPVATPTTTQVNAARPFDIVVPSGRVWVEGDHRDDSADSRSHTGDTGGGTIPEGKIIGRAFVIVWPIGHAHGLSIPSSYRSLANATAVGLPYGIGAAAVLPVGFVRLRRRKRGRRGLHGRGLHGRGLHGRGLHGRGPQVVSKAPGAAS